VNFGPDHMRDLRKGEEPAVDTLLRAAFRGPDEAELVKSLRQAGAMAGESVLPMGDAIIGYFALSKMRQPKGWLCLAPVAIDPAYQGRNFGKRMIGMLVEWARISGAYVVVLGDVPFYEKAGFSAARAAGLTSPYPVAHTLLAGPGTDVPQQTLIYPKAFDTL